jgi:ATP-dependent DNA helicase RecG
MSTSPQKTAAERLATPAKFIKGVGPQRAEVLEKLRLRRASDLLFFFPRDYQDMSELRGIAQLEEDTPLSVCGTVQEVDLRNTGPGRCILGVLVRDDTDHLRAVWFNQPYMRQRFSPGQRVLLSGSAKRQGLRWEMAHPQVEYLDPGQTAPAGRILPVYPLTEGINQGKMRQIVQHVAETCSEAVDEVFPEAFLDEHNLWPIRAALPQIHMPSDRGALEQARHRFIYQELLVLQLALALRRQSLTTNLRAPELPTSGKIDARIVRLFPFELTADQRRAIDEVAADMARPHPMNRLLQGEVGSGKTVVAVYAMLLAVAHGHQAALMAPTEVLARQHYRTLSVSLAESKVRFALLVGSLTTAQRRKTLKAIAAGEVDLVVGTQAVISDKVQFHKLGLVVIDEQHKFGVRQRATLRQAGLDPHYLVMTATPIPRTVAMTQFGDLDVSTLRNPPPGRQPVHTYVGDEERREKWWEFFRKKLREGRQGFVITPLVDESDVLEVSNVESAFEHLANGELADFRIDLVHGRLDPAAKDAAMQSFESGDTQVLVATSVVEVGVDVPNATVMTIESGHRFGLAQLHQLRGRVSRGTHPGYVCVFHQGATEEARDRLEAFSQSTDGFELSEIDFQMRGPGELLGTRQHGLPPLRIADLSRDKEELTAARRDAQQLVAGGELLSNPDYQRLLQMVLKRYGKALELGDVG